MGKSKRISPPRWFHQFQLRRDVAFDNHIHEIIAALNRERAFRQNVIDGIRLIWDLRHMHREDVLLELFPDIVERLQIKLTPPPTPIDPKSFAIALVEEMQQMKDIKPLVEGGLVASPVLEQRIDLNGGLKPLQGARPLSLPTFDDDELDTLVLRKDTHTDASQNFFDSAMGLNH